MGESLIVVRDIDWLTGFGNCDRIVEIFFDGAERSFELFDIEGGVRVSIRFIR